MSSSTSWSLNLTAADLPAVCAILAGRPKLTARGDDDEPVGGFAAAAAERLGADYVDAFPPTTVIASGGDGLPDHLEQLLGAVAPYAVGELTCTDSADGEQWRYLLRDGQVRRCSIERYAPDDPAWPVPTSPTTQHIVTACRGTADDAAAGADQLRRALHSLLALFDSCAPPDDAVTAAALATDHDVLGSLANDDDAVVRLAVAINPATPEAALAQLALDVHPVVAVAVARRTDAPAHIRAVAASAPL